MGRGGGGVLLATNMSDLSPSRWVDEREWEEMSPNSEQPLRIEAPLPGKCTTHYMGMSECTEPPFCKHAAAAVTYSTPR